MAAKGRVVIAVIFELWAAEPDRYFALAADLRDELSLIDGFLSIERFRSLVDPDKFLSLSCWRDELAVAAWRTTEHHREAQAAGRGGVLRDYRLRVATVVRDYGLSERAEAPADSRLDSAPLAAAESPDRQSQPSGPQAAPSA